MQLPTVGFFALRVELAADCAHLGPGHAERPALQCGLSELSPSTFKRGVEVKVSRRRAARSQSEQLHCGVFKLSPPTTLGPHVFAKVRAQPQTSALFETTLLEVQSVYRLLERLIQEPGQRVQQVEPELAPLLAPAATITIDDVTTNCLSIQTMYEDGFRMLGLKPSKHNNGLKVVTKVREECV
eukprot:SAG31_NODE_1659_length_7602_cov_7.696122_2_plen_184_part_00